jgi:hypothetical protein
MKIPPNACKPCEACQAPILFAITGYVTKRDRDPATGRATREPKWMPVDPAPTPDGNVVISLDKGAWLAAVPRRGQLAGMKAAGVETHASHMQTCPDRERFARTHRGRQRQQG